MNRKLAKELKAAGFRTRFYQVGHRFYPSETNAEWSESERATPTRAATIAHTVRTGVHGGRPNSSRWRSGLLEATPGIEPGYTVLQTVA